MNKIKIIILIILVAAAGFAGYTVTKKGILNPGEKPVVNNNQQAVVSPTQKPAPNYEKIVGNFLITNNEVCLENGKPIVYFFGSSSCPHCVWEKPVAKKTFDQFKNEIAYKENFDSQDNMDIFQKYSDINPGYVPFLIIGCKYARVGAGENLGKDDAESKKLEEEAMTAIVCKLTDGKPASICASVKEQTATIK